MKKLNGKIFLLAATATLMLAACERSEQPEIAGKGGNATLRITPRHHSVQIDSCQIFIKYNASDKPTSPYDDSVWCKKVNGIPVGTFTGLKKGKYYLFGRGYDTSIQLPVKGGSPFLISEEKVYDYNLAVTED